MSDNDSTAGSGEITLSASKKMYYSISEVAQTTGLEQSVLRHWEKEFSKLRPKKNSAGKRAYREKDIELVKRIKQLLKEEGYTIQGAKQRLAEERGGGAKDEKSVVDEVRTKPSTDKPTPVPLSSPSVSPDVLADIRNGLQDVLTLLGS